MASVTPDHCMPNQSGLKSGGARRRVGKGGRLLPPFAVGAEGNSSYVHV